MIMLVLVLPLISNAQMVSINDIKKIDLSERSGGMSGQIQAEFEIINNNDDWKCYQTKLYYSGWMLSNARDGKDYTRLNTDERKFVKNISGTSVNNLLQAVARPRPVFKPGYIAFNLNDLEKKIDSVYFKGPNNRFTPRQQQEFIGLLHNKKITDEAVTFMQTNYATDVFSFCSIHIIKKNNDTLKIESKVQFDYMLPWKVNGVVSYNTGFNSFLINAMADHYGSLKDKLSGRNVFYGIFDYVESEYARDLFERERIQGISPANLTLLKQHFVIYKASRNNNNDHTLISLSPGYAPKNILINADLNIADAEGINHLIHFSEDTLSQFLKKENFIIKNCRAIRGCQVVFGTTLKSSNFRLHTANGMDRTNYLKKYNTADIVSFRVNMPGKMFGNEWLYLPDGKLVLYGYIRTPVTGLAAGKIKISNEWEDRRSFVVFDTLGNVINDFTDM